MGDLKAKATVKLEHQALTATKHRGSHSEAVDAPPVPMTKQDKNTDLCTMQVRVLTSKLAKSQKPFKGLPGGPDEPPPEQPVVQTKVRPSFLCQLGPKSFF